MIIYNDDDMLPVCQSFQ